MTWIKICGITNLEDALIAVEAGADALGFVFYEKSPRNIDPDTAREIVRQLPDNIERVGIFVDKPTLEVRRFVEGIRLTAVQLYNEECAKSLASNWAAEHAPGQPPKIMMVIPGDQFAASGGVHLINGASWSISKSCKEILFALLVDSSSDSQLGGTGRPFDWTRVRGMIQGMSAICRTVVAGGLTPSNVGVAITVLGHPWGVDVSSGVEAHPGKKDPAKVRAFITAVRSTEGNH